MELTSREHGGAARPDSIPTSARYVPWEPEAGDCLRPPGPRGSNPESNPLRRPDHGCCRYPYFRKLTRRSQFLVGCNLFVGDIAMVENQVRAGLLDLSVELSSPELFSGEDFAVYLIVKNPFDRPIWISAVKVNVPSQMHWRGEGDDTNNNRGGTNRHGHPKEKETDGGTSSNLIKNEPSVEALMQIQF
jgi:hypothetical protein